LHCWWVTQTLNRSWIFPVAWTTGSGQGIICRLSAQTSS
jgi:hypothetical protein